MPKKDAGQYRGCNWMKIDGYYFLLGGQRDEKFFTLPDLKRYVNKNCVWSGHYTTDRNNWGG